MAFDRKAHYQANKDRQLARQRERWVTDESYRSRQKEVQRGNSTMRLYGVSAEQKKQMWLGQGKQCAICHKELELWGIRGAYIDHDHDTGQVRALLCSGCNRNVAALESPLFDLTAEYLQSWRT